MKPFGLAILALSFPALALVGCGGNSGTQITSITRALDIEEGTSYPDATPVVTVGTTPVAALASFTTKTSQKVVLWGSRDESTGRVTSIRQMAYSAPNVAPLYAKYDETGGLATVLDTDTGSFVTFGALDGSSLLCHGYDGTRDHFADVRATLSDIGVTIEVLNTGDGRSTPQREIVPLSELDSATRSVRTLPPTDPLAGLDAALQEPATRTRIIQAIVKAAGLVVKDPFKSVLRNVSGFMLLDKFNESYGQYLVKGTLPTPAASGAPTPLAYRDDLP